MTTREIVVLQIAGFLLIVLMLVIMGERQNAKYEQQPDLYCPEPSQKLEAEERCEFKLRDVRSGHSALTRL